MYDPQEFTTRSFGLVAALQLYGHRPTAVRDAERGKRLFSFRRTAALNAAIADYFSGALVVSAKDFTDAMQDIKRTYTPRGVSA